MKLLIAIINSDDSHKVLNEISRAGLYATKLSTAGGFLKAGNTTLLMGVEDDRLEDALDIFRKDCSKREETTTVSMPDFSTDFLSAPTMKLTVGGATVFVLNVEQFYKM